MTKVVNTEDNVVDIKDYGLFSSGVASTKKLNEALGKMQTIVTNSKKVLEDAEMFLGPMATSADEGLKELFNRLETMVSNFSEVESYLINASETYQSSDKNAAEVLKLNKNTGKVERVISSCMYDYMTPVSSVTIPSDIDQSGYLVTCYGPGGWHLGGEEAATKIASGTKQDKVHDKWVEAGAKYKDGIAALEIDGVDHYLVATSPTYGTVGDKINVKFENGESIPCVIADAKSTRDSNYTKYGHQKSNGVNVLEFEVDRNKYRSSGNPTTEKWGLEWDSSSKVQTVDNFGTMI